MKQNWRRSSGVHFCFQREDFTCIRINPTRKTDIPLTQSSFLREKSPPAENACGDRKDARMQRIYLKNPVMEAGVCHVETVEENLHKLFLWKQFSFESTLPLKDIFLWKKFSFERNFSLKGRFVNVRPTLLISVAFSVVLSKNMRRASTLKIFTFSASCKMKTSRKDHIEMGRFKKRPNRRWKVFKFMQEISKYKWWISSIKPKVWPCFNLYQSYQAGDRDLTHHNDLKDSKIM